MEDTDAIVALKAIAFADHVLHTMATTDPNKILIQECRADIPRKDNILAHNIATSDQHS